MLLNILRSPTGDPKLLLWIAFLIICTFCVSRCHRNVMCAHVLRVCHTLRIFNTLPQDQEYSLPRFFPHFMKIHTLNTTRRIQVACVWGEHHNHHLCARSVCVIFLFAGRWVRVWHWRGWAQFQKQIPQQCSHKVEAERFAENKKLRWRVSVYKETWCASSCLR